jgi:hypothetical protein
VRPIGGGGTRKRSSLRSPVPRASKRPGPAPANSRGTRDPGRDRRRFCSPSRGSRWKGEREVSQKPNVTRPKSLKAKSAVPEVDLGFRWGMLNGVLLLLGVAVLAGGYKSLAGGSLTLAPVLLVTGYCVLIPASLLVRASGSNEGE